MHMNKYLRILAGAIAELFLWVVPAVFFLSAYVLYFNGPDSSIAPHLKLIGSMALAWLGLRLAVEHLDPGRFIKVTFQVLYSLGLVFLLLYYAMILIGLSNWGRVPTLRLLEVYFHQWRELVAVLDAPVLVVPLTLAVIFTIVFLLVRLTHSRLRWPQRFATFARFRMSLVLAVGGLVPFGVLAFETYDAVDNHSGEPVMLSLNAGLDADDTQSNQSEGARQWDKREAEAAASYRPGVLAAPRNVILIVSDALRADHLSALEYPRPTTPFLDSLAAAGRFALIQHIQSVCAESYCGLMGIARSRFVHEFSRASLTLQQALARHGYRIQLILGGDHTNFYGLSEALGPADLYWDGSMSGTYVNDDRGVLDRVSQLANWDGKPEFLQLHLMSTHGLGLRQESFVQFEPARNYYRHWPGANDMSGRQAAVNYYDNGVLQFDATVKALLEILQQRGYLDDAVVIITGDHGEMLGEHDQYTHAHGVYHPVLDIPLMMLRYGYTGSEIAPRDFASQVDIAPTVLQELGLPVPAGWSGTGLQNPLLRDFLYFQQGGDVGLFDLRDTGRVWKFWMDMSSENSFAFDATRDTDEAQNLIGEVPTRLRSDWMIRLLPAGVTIGERALSDPLAGPDKR
jgi:hypothetical protein